MRPEMTATLNDDDPFGRYRDLVAYHRHLFSGKIDEYERRRRGLNRLPPARREIERRFLDRMGDHLREQAAILERMSKRAGIKGTAP